MTAKIREYPSMKGVIGIILAGGRGERLEPLTLFRAKPGVPFGGKYRIIDFVMNNFLNSDIQVIKVLIQSRSQSLKQHIERLYPSVPQYRYFIDTVPAQQKTGDEWYEGTADAVYQNLDLLEAQDFQVAAIFAGDHIFKMDVRQMYREHIDKDSDFTIAAVAVEVEKAAGQLGVIEVDSNYQVVGFEEKPEKPKEIPGRPGWCFSSMGNYLADIPLLSLMLHEDSIDESSKHDFGKNIIPTMLKKGISVFAYDFSQNRIPGQICTYWRDVGRIGEFWAANMDLRNLNPELNLYNPFWPIRTFPDNTPPAKLVCKPDADNFILSGGCVITGGKITGSVLGQNVIVENATVEDCVIFPSVVIREGAHLKKCIVDKKVLVPKGVQVGFSEEDDKARGLTVKDGITIIPKGYIFKQ